MQAQMLDLYRAGIRSAADMMKLSLEQTERFQQQQLQLIRHALDESTRSTAQAGEVKGLDDMVAFNSRLAGAQLERVGEFWANWWRAAADAQSTFLNYGYAQLESGAGSLGPLGAEYGPERYCMQLYHRVSGAVELRGKTVLECTRVDLAKRFRTRELVILAENPDASLFERIINGVMGKLGHAPA